MGRRNQTLLRQRRGEVYHRDRAICAMCGLDCDAQQVEFDRLPYLERSRVRFDHGFKRANFTCWAMDHITPVSEGGTDEMDNLRTLCLPCHDKETKALFGRLGKAGRLGAGRRKAQRLAAAQRNMRSLRERFTAAMPPETPYETVTVLWEQVGQWLRAFEESWVAANGDDPRFDDVIAAWEVDGK